MHRRFGLPTPRHARHATSIACDSGPASPAGETRRYGFNTPLAQREQRAWGRQGSEGRIAERPRLQHAGLSGLSLKVRLACPWAAVRVRPEGPARTLSSFDRFFTQLAA